LFDRFFLTDFPLMPFSAAYKATSRLSALVTRATSVCLRRTFERHSLTTQFGSCAPVTPSFLLHALPSRSIGEMVVGKERDHDRMAPKEPSNVVVSSTSERIQPEAPSGIAWLETMPRGAYTTARTTGGGKCVFELGFHLQRLIDSARLMDMAVSSSDSVKHRILETVRSGILAYMKHNGAYDDTADLDDREMKITVLLVPSTHEETVAVHVHVSPLGPRKAPGIPVRVEIRGSPRSNAAAKDSDWVSERKKLAKPDDVNELVLEKEGALYEGLSSNFFALMDGVLYTAGEDILLGSVREAVLRQAEIMGLPIILEPPRVEDANRWEAAFISSTSRMLLPIDLMSIISGSSEDLPKVREFNYGQSSVARVLEERVREDILSSSEEL